MRRGSRAGTSSVVVSVLLAEHEDARASAPAAGSEEISSQWRCGFIVSKAVGNAVIRHRTTRRLRHIIRELMEEPAVEVPDGRRAEIVVRALGEAPATDHAGLVADLRSGLRRGIQRAVQKDQKKAELSPQKLQTRKS